MANPKKNIEHLNQRALRITPPTILVPLAATTTDIVENAMWQAGSHHILTPSQKGPEVVEEHGRGTVLVHALQRASEIL